MNIFAAVTAALAVWLWAGPGGGQLCRLRAARPGGVPRWLAGRPGAPELNLRLAVGLGVGVGVLVWLPGLWGVAGGALAAALVVVGLGFLETGRNRAQRQLVLHQLPMALDLMAAVLAAGVPLSGAARAVAAVSPAETAAVLAQVDARVRVGSTDAEAWRGLVAHPVWGEAARDLARSAQSGTALRAVLVAHAQDARRQAREELQAKARQVGVKVALPLMCCFLPAFMLTGVAPVVLGLVQTYLGR